MLVGAIASSHSVSCLKLRANRSTLFVKTLRAGFPLVNLTRHHVYWAERMTNVELLRVGIPPSCPRPPIPRLLAHDDTAMRLAFEFVPSVPADAIPVSSQNLPLATCLHDFLVHARVTHGGISCKHLMWTQLDGAVHLMLVDFGMATFEYSDWNATSRQATILSLIAERLKRAHAVLKQRKVAKGAAYFEEADTNAQRGEQFAQFVQFVDECALRRRQGLDSHAGRNPPCPRNEVLAYARARPSLTRAQENP